MAVKIIHLPLLSEDASSRIQELQMLETPFHHRCIRYYVLFISIDNIALLVTSLVDMSLKNCNTFISECFKIIHPGRKTDTFFSV